MEENEGKSKMPVKPIDVGLPLFILVAVSALAYAGYVYHRNSQRNEALAWVKTTLNKEPHFETRVRNSVAIINSSHDISMERDSACSIELRHVYERWFTPLVTDYPRSWLGDNVMKWTCRTDLNKLTASEVKVYKETDPANEFPGGDVSRFRYEGYPYWKVCLAKSTDEMDCTITPGSSAHASEVLTVDSNRKCFEMQDEDSANRVANAFKAAIRLCGGKDEPFSNETDGKVSTVATPREDETPQATDAANTNLDEASTATHETSDSPKPQRSSDLIVEVATPAYHDAGSSYASARVVVFNRSDQTMRDVYLHYRVYDGSNTMVGEGPVVISSIPPHTRANDLSGLYERAVRIVIDQVRYNGIEFSGDVVPR